MSSSDRVTPSARVTLGAVVIRVGLPVLGVALLMAGLLGIVSYGVLPSVDALRSRDWQPVEASIDYVGLRLPPSRLHPNLDAVEIRYRYFAAGAEHSGVRYDPHDGQYSRPLSQEVFARLQSAGTIAVWVNPADPDDAMVSRELRWPVLFFTLPALALALAGGLMLFAGMLAWSHDGRSWPRHPDAS
jgi:uncharacterized protein DUF3592